MTDNLEDFEGEVFERDTLAAKPGGDGMPIGNTMTPGFEAGQVRLDPEGIRSPEFDDDAAATMVWYDFQQAINWLDNMSWQAEWQYIDYLYQSPNFDYDWRQQDSYTATISRFNVAKNRNTMSNQTRRAVFAGQVPFVLEPRGRTAGLKNAQMITDAWTEILSLLDERAEFEYNFGLLIECQGLQGTGNGIPIWEERTITKKTRKPKTPPVKVDLPVGGPKEIHTWESDDWEVVEENVVESWPCFEYRRLGTTIWDEGWRTPNRPDLTAKFRFDVDYVTFEDLQQMRKLACYKDIPSDKDLKTYFLQHPRGDAPEGSATTRDMNGQSGAVVHAAPEGRNVSQNPLLRPLMKIARWDREWVYELLVYDGRKKIIRKERHSMGDHALGYSATWWNIDNSGYGLGIGRLNAGDQRMDQGVLNEVLKMIAFPMNAPLLYNSASGNAPTQNHVTALGQMWGINVPSGDIRKELMWMQPPEIPKEAWDIYKLGKDGGEDLVGANSTTMQGNVGGPGSTALKTATGVNRIGGKADENIAEPLSHLEQIIIRWNRWKYDMVCERMPIREIRQILSDKYGDAILDQISSEEFLNAEFNIKVLAGQKMAAKAAITQLVPFFLQLIQQPQLLQFEHEKGETINFGAIAKLFLQMSELAGREDIFIPLTDEQKQMVQQMNPNAMKAQMVQLQEQLRGKNKLDEVQAKSQAELQKTIVDHALDHVEGSVPLDLAEARLTRNTDMTELQQGVPGLEQE